MNGLTLKLLTSYCLAKPHCNFFHQKLMNKAGIILLNAVFIINTIAENRHFNALYYTKEQTIKFLSKPPSIYKRNSSNCRKCKLTRIISHNLQTL